MAETLAEGQRDVTPFTITRGLAVPLLLTVSHDGAAQVSRGYKAGLVPSL